MSQVASHKVAYRIGMIVQFPTTPDTVGGCFTNETNN